MARDLATFPFVTPRDSDYPNGRIVDKGPSNHGTPVNEYTNGDIQQFFAKLMREAAIPYNGLPDSEYTGNQLWSSFLGNGFNNFSSPLVRGILGSYVANDVIIVYGLVPTFTNSGNTVAWTDGVIFYNDKFYFIENGSDTKSSGLFIFVITDQNNFTATITHGSSGRIGDYTIGTFQLKGNWVQITSTTGINLISPSGSVSFLIMNYKDLGDDVLINFRVGFSASGSGSLSVVMPLPINGVTDRDEFGSAVATITSDDKPVRIARGNVVANNQFLLSTNYSFSSGSISVAGEFRYKKG